MSEIKLLPCPFCGGEAYLYEDKKCDIYSVGCKNCCDIEPITRVCESKEEAIKLWNTRKPMQDIVERLEEIKKIMLSPKNVDCFGEPCTENDCMACVINKAIDIVEEAGGMND